MIVLSLNQFTRFMAVIQKLGKRVEQEHTRYLRDHQRLDDKTSPGPSTTPDFSSGVSFEQLITRKEKNTVENAVSPPWDEDEWGSVLRNTQEQVRLEFADCKKI